MPPEGITPTIITCNPSSAQPSQSVTYTIQFDGTADGINGFAITTTQQTAFSSIPSLVVPEVGTTQVQFQGTLSSSFTGTVGVAAAANEVQKSVNLRVQNVNG